jgi:hypothetical protein
MAGIANMAEIPVHNNHLAIEPYNHTSHEHFLMACNPLIIG